MIPFHRGLEALREPSVHPPVTRLAGGSARVVGSRSLDRAATRNPRSSSSWPTHLSCADGSAAARCN